MSGGVLGWGFWGWGFGRGSGSGLFGVGAGFGLRVGFGWVEELLCIPGQVLPIKSALVGTPVWCRLLKRQTNTLLQVI